MSPLEILDALSRLGLSIWANGDRLMVTPVSKVPPFLAREIMENKTELMSLILQPLVGSNVTVGFYRPPGKNQPRIPINGDGTTVRGQR